MKFNISKVNFYYKNLHMHFLMFLTKSSVSSFLKVALGSALLFKSRNARKTNLNQSFLFHQLKKIAFKQISALIR